MYSEKALVKPINEFLKHICAQLTHKLMWELESCIILNLLKNYVLIISDELFSYIYIYIYVLVHCFSGDFKFSV